MVYGVRDSFLYGSYKRVRGALRNSGRGFLSGARNSVEFDITFGGLKLDEAELKYQLNSRNGMVGSHLNRIARIITSQAKNQVGAETGRLRSSINWDYRSDNVGQSRVIGSPLPYAYLHHEGTSPHLIEPKKAQVLTFKSKGGVLINTEQVMHPGTPPNRYLSDQIPVVAGYLRMLPRA